MLGAGKIWTARIAAATPEQQGAWHTMHVIVDSFGIIFKARSDPALFGVKTEELMGQSVAFCIDYFRNIIERGGSMVEGIKTLLAEAKSRQVWRVGICPKGRRTIPGLMKVGSAVKAAAAPQHLNPALSFLLSCIFFHQSKNRFVSSSGTCLLGVTKLSGLYQSYLCTVCDFALQLPWIQGGTSRFQISVHRPQGSVNSWSPI